MEDLHSLVDMKGIQWYLSVETGTRHPILFLERPFSFNKFNHCGKPGREFAAVQTGDYIIYIGLFAFSW